MKSLASSEENIVFSRGMSYQVSLRQKIDGHLLLEQLMLCALGRIELSSAQVTCIRIGLGKLMPDLAAMQVSIDQNKPVTRQDVDGLLLAAGLQPEQEWSSVQNASEVDGEPEQAFASPEKDK